MEPAKLQQLVIQAQQGDVHAMEELYTLSVKNVYYLALKILCDPNDAEDLTQDVFITVYEKLGTLKQPEAYYRWLNLITFRKFYNAMQVKRPMPETDEKLRADPQEELHSFSRSGQSTGDDMEQRLILEAIDALPEDQRAYALFYDCMRLTVAQIAEVTGLHENTEKNRLTLVRARIQDRLEKAGHKPVIPMAITSALHRAQREYTMSQAQMAGIWDHVSRAAGIPSPSHPHVGVNTPPPPPPIQIRVGMAPPQNGTDAPPPPPRMRVGRASPAPRRRPAFRAVVFVLCATLLLGGAWAFLYGPLGGLLPSGLGSRSSVSKELDVQVEAVSIAIDETLAALSDGHVEKSDSEVIAALYDTALELERQGHIRNISTEQVGIIFDYAEGTPGGIIMEPALYTNEATSEESAAATNTSGIDFEDAPAIRPLGSASLSIGGSDLLWASLTASPASTPNVQQLAIGANTELNLIGNKKVFFGESIPTASPSEDWKPYSDIVNLMRTSGIKDLTVTENRRVTLSDLEAIYDYGVVFLNLPCGWSKNGKPFVLLEEKYVIGGDHGAYPDKLRGVGTYSLVSPMDPAHDLDRIITTGNRWTYKNVFGVNLLQFYNSKKQSLRFPNSYIHLGINNGLALDSLSNLLLARGAGCVSGYSAFTNPAKQDHEMVSLIADYLTKPYTDGHGCPIDYIELMAASLSATQYDYVYRYYEDNINWNTATLTGTSCFSMQYPRGDLRLWKNDTAAPPQSGQLPYQIGDPSSEAQTYMVGIIEAFFQKDAAKLASEFDYETFSKQYVGGVLDPPPSTYDQRLSRMQQYIDEVVDVSGPLLHIVFGESKDSSFTQKEGTDAMDTEYVTYPAIEFQIFAITENGCVWFYGRYLKESGKLQSVSAFSNAIHEVHLRDNTVMDGKKLVEAAGYTWPY